MRKIISVIAIFMMLILITGCTQVAQNQKESNQDNINVVNSKGSYFSSNNFDPKIKLELKKFSTEDELKSFMAVRTNSYGYGMYNVRSMLSSVAPTAMMEKSVAMDASSGSSISQNVFSETNNQVASVDEADMIKNDGEYIYTISQNKVFIVKAYPGNESKIISEITFNETKSPQAIFLKDNKLAIFGSFYDKKYFKELGIKYNGMTFFEIYDLSDKSNPKLTSEYKFEGNYYQARMTNGYIYMIVISNTDDRSGPIMPLIMKGESKSYVSLDKISYFPIPYNYPQLVTVHSINFDTENNDNSASVVIEGINNMYMSEKNIYIAYTKYVNEWEMRTDFTKEIIMQNLTDDEKILVEKIKNTDNDVLSNFEKDQKIMQVVYEHIDSMDEKERDSFYELIDNKTSEKMKEYEYLEYTVINKINVDKGNINIASSGKIPGRLNNQFSMDEKDDVLRVASTISERWPIMPMYSKVAVDSAAYVTPKPTDSENHIYSLDKDMNIIGSLKGLAKTEQIYSTRFIGDRLYMVTFRQVDPFFVIDLSDPKDIKEIGKLKIPGFSRYLHPYDENTLIGIGRDATELGRTQGLKISLFDVTDVENPKEIAKFVTDEKYASSTAEYEHKAFLFNKEKELLVIPAYSYTYTWDEKYGSSKEDYNGAMVFKINKNEVTLRGIIDHSGANPYYYGSMVERSLFINEMLYTKSLGLLRVNKIDDLSSVNKIELKSESKNSYVVY